MPGNCGLTFPQGKSARTEAPGHFRPGSVLSFNLTSLGNTVCLAPVGTLFCCCETEKGLGSSVLEWTHSADCASLPNPKFSDVRLEIEIHHDTCIYTMEIHTCLKFTPLFSECRFISTALFVK